VEAARADLAGQPPSSVALRRLVPQPPARRTAIKLAIGRGGVPGGPASRRRPPPCRA
jgi:hypothetical protein